MGMTIAEKILALHSGREEVRPGEFVWAKVDGTSISSGNTYRLLKEIGVKKLFDPDRVYVTRDHLAPPSSTAVAEEDRMIRKAVEEFGISNWFEYGRHGIAHQLFPEKGFCVPGDLIAMGDSHTTTYGAFNAASCPINVEEVYVLTTGRLWFMVPRTIKFELIGKLSEMCVGKDVILKIAGDYGTDVALYKSVEFSGPVANAMSLSSRWTVANMGVEIGAKFAIFEADHETFDFLKGRTNRPFNPVSSDVDAKYEQEFTVDVTSLEPQVACPHDVGHVRTVTEVEKENVRVNQAFIGSCTNGRMEDLQMAANILRGRKVHKDVRLIVSPASMEVWRDALKAGLLEVFAEAEAMICHPTCGPCFGGHMGVLASGEVCISSTNRNFKGRMGSLESKVYLGNAATVAASAITGKITDPRKYA